MRWYSLEPADADFLTSAPHLFRYRKRFAARPERVWESLTSDASLAAWGPLVTDLKWLSPRPFGIGTERELVLAPGLSRVRERFFRWDEGRRYSFAAYQANSPLLRRFAEDYVVETDGGDGTLFSWTVGLEPKGPLSLPFRALNPVLKTAFGRMATDGQRYFAKRG